METRVGYYPVIDNPAVWQKMVGNQWNGQALTVLRDRLAYAFTGDQLWSSTWASEISQTLDSQGIALLTDTNPESRLKLLQQSADQLAGGGG
jgi:hypothetical protein